MEGGWSKSADRGPDHRQGFDLRRGDAGQCRRPDAGWLRSRCRCRLGYRCQGRGAIVTCKTTTCELGYKLTADSPVSGVTRNPWHLGRTSGGSSGGAAAVIAAGCGPLAIATDGVGSIRVPCSFCGVFGLKPTYGLVPRSPGFFPPSWPSLAHTGPIARTVGDAALLLGVIAVHDRRDPGSLPVEHRSFAAKAGRLDGLRIGFTPDFGYTPVARDVRAAFKRAIDALADLGAEVAAADPGVDPDVLEGVLKPIAFTEQAAATSGRDPALFARSDQDYRDVIAKGRSYSGVDYMTATHRRMICAVALVDLFRRVDALVTPTVAVTAFAAGAIGVEEIDGRKVDSHLGWSPFSWPINLAGLPAATGALRMGPRGPSNRSPDRCTLAGRGHYTCRRRRARASAALGQCLARPRSRLELRRGDATSKAIL